MSSKSQARLGALIRKYREAGGMTQGALANAVSEKAGRKVGQANVSAHELGQRWESRGTGPGGIDLLAAYIEVLGIPEDEWRDALGLAVEEPDPRPKGFAEIVQSDKSLSKAAKEHLLNQYELLQMATMHQRRGEPVLRQDKTDQRRKQA